MMEDESKLLNEIDELKAHLRESEETLKAIQKGDVDAIIVKGDKGDQLYSLISPDHPYQGFIENMGEAALVLSKEGIILYSNPGFSEMLGYSSESTLGLSIRSFLDEAHKPYFMDIFEKCERKKFEFCFVTKDQIILTLSVSIFKGTWDQSDKIFEKFAQADSSSTRSYQGSGLGLSICKNIVEGHGGTIKYETKIGEGTIFSFELPKFKES